MIRGKKNFVYPTRLEMGVTLLYKIDDSCVAKHLEDRKPKSLAEQDEERDVSLSQTDISNGIEMEISEKKLAEPVLST